MAALPKEALQLCSIIRRDGELELSLVSAPVPEPGEDEVLIRVDAAPINPSDQANLFGPADLSTIAQSGSRERPIITASIPEAALASVAGRLDKPMAVGNEGAGTVVKAGPSALAQSLVGKTVAAFATGMYCQFRCADAASCIVLPEDTTAEEGASCFVNPLTALSMVETMKREGHRALVHTAAASNLGQMLQKLCLKDGVPLINIVRSDPQVAFLRAIGAAHVCNSTSPDFQEELTQALVDTGATIAFDATGGGTLASSILSCMEAAIGRRSRRELGRPDAVGRKPDADGRYGSEIHKQVYLYGNLERGPTLLTRAYGSAWSVGGWLLFPFLAKIGPEHAQRLRDRVAAELKTTFASRYTKRVSLAGMLQPDAIAEYSRRATDSKYLVCPQAD
jgi:NADPH:quinone reductase-like Zn-dependent oxidoreductase